MHNPQDAIALITVPLSAIFGNKAGTILAEADMMPDWASHLLGPLGALAGTILAIRWLLARLDKAEIKADIREKERDANLTLIAQMTMQNQTVISQNSEILHEVKCAIQKNIETNKP